MVDEENYLMLVVNSCRFCVDVVGQNAAVFCTFSNLLFLLSI